MILDPNRNGIEVFYDNKLRILEGRIEECVDFLLKLTLMEYDENDDWCQDAYKGHKKTPIITHCGKKYIQICEYDKFYLDTNGFGRLWEDYFRKIGLKVDKLDVKRIKL